MTMLTCAFDYVFCACIEVSVSLKSMLWIWFWEMCTLTCSTPHFTFTLLVLSSSAEFNGPLKLVKALLKDDYDASKRIYDDLSERSGMGMGDPLRSMLSLGMMLTVSYDVGMCALLRKMFCFGAQIPPH